MNRFSWTSLLCAMGLLAPSDAPAQDSLLVHEYAAKFVCGPTATARVVVVAPGTYHTAINVHNPNRDSLIIARKYAFTGVDGRPGRIVVDSIPLLLNDDQAAEVDCVRITRVAGLRGFAKGFVVLHSQLPLDVVGVYTAAAGTTGVTTMHLERVPARMVKWR